jgi:asparagine synthase (glutamine-hydrolysing)
MCGIAGMLGSAHQGELEDACRVLSHRGPDDSGTWLDPDARIGLVHTRLAIVDCTDAGHQPMHSPDGRLVVVYNGEIYNHLALRNELASAGHRFRSHSDTEVLLAAYAQWGEQCLSRFQGMFAFAVVDRSPPDGGPSLFLARDRFGIKPLLFHANGKVVRFASELRGLFALGVERRVDVEALGDFAAFGSASEPRTFVRDVRALPPGHFLAVRDGRRSLHRYWDLHEATERQRAEYANISPERAVDLVREGLSSAAQAHLVADVPVGAFLSGGIDSTAIVGWMGKLTEQPVRTFAVGFASGGDSIDERAYAQIAATHLHAEHRDVLVDGMAVAREFEDLVDSLGQPSNDGPNTWFVSRATRPHVTVALSGLGGDELFAGYAHFERMARAPSPSRRVLSWPLRLIAAIRPTPIASRLLDRIVPDVHRYRNLRRLLVDERLDRQRAAEPGTTAERVAAEFNALVPAGADTIQQVTYLETRTYLVNTLLRDVDAMSMRHSLEVRPMLLHHPLAELVYALPERLKTGEWRNKRLLIDASADFIPKVLRSRPKNGFVMPWLSWMQGPLRPLVLSELTSEWAQRILHRGYRRRLIERAENGRPTYAHWAWTVLFAWLRQSRVSL